MRTMSISLRVRTKSKGDKKEPTHQMHFTGPPLVYPPRGLPVGPEGIDEATPLSCLPYSLDVDQHAVEGLIVQWCALPGQSPFSHAGTTCKSVG